MNARHPGNEPGTIIDINGAPHVDIMAGVENASMTKINTSRVPDRLRIYWQQLFLHYHDSGSCATIWSITYSSLVVLRLHIFSSSELNATIGNRIYGTYDDCNDWRSDCSCPMFHLTNS